MSKRPPIQAKFSFGEDGEVRVEAPKIEKPVFEVGDKVRFDPEYPHMKGIFIVDSILLTWGDPLYIVYGCKGKESLFSCCAAKALIKVE